MKHRIFGMAVLAAGLVCAAGAGAADQKAPGAPVVDVAARCAQLVGKMPDLPDAPTEVTEAKLTDSDGDIPAYCGVKGTVAPDVGFETRLPTTTWNGKFLLFGRGGYCRTVAMADCNEPLRKGFACVVADQGHKATDSDDMWAYDNLQAKVDCGFRGNHVAAVAGKAITEKFYGKPPAHSYFQGCSTGGRMAMVEAERFPYDFDGIIAGAPPISKSANLLGLTWNAVAPLNKDGKQILTPEAVKLVAGAVMAKCDMDDGVKDGVIGNPFACKFDPAALQCKGDAKADCLSKEQVEAVRKLYQGPVNSKGQHLYNGSLLPGSEPNWIKSYVSEDGKPAQLYGSMMSSVRYTSHPDRPAGWQLTQFDWDRDYKNMGFYEAFMADDNPDLRPFKAAGGKLLIYHGLTDQLVLPGATVDFYKEIERLMGSEAATKDFARLFLIPGLNHCNGGAGATVFDYVKYLDDWVAGGKAPDAMVGAHLKDGGPVPGGVAMKQPLDPATVAFTRPVYAYPMMAKYKGSGDVNDAANFSAVPSVQ